MSLLAAAVCVFLVSYPSSSDSPSLLALALLALTSLLAERQSVKLVPSIEISVAFFPVLFTAVLYGGFWAGLVGGVGLLLRFGRPYLRWTSWFSTRIIVASVAGDVAQLSRFSDSFSLGSLTLSAVAAVVVYTILDTVFAAMTLKVRRTAKVVELIKMAVLIDVVSVLLYSPVIAILAYAFLEAPRWTLVLFIAPAFATQRLFILYREQADTAKSLSEAIARLERVNLSFATALVTALDARDHYTAGHSAAVAVYARDIAKKLNLSEEEQNRAHVCGLLHDIGKIGVPTGVLEKRGPLKADERVAIEAHAEIGASILGRIEGYEEMAFAVRHHHERYDGVGYPDEREGEEIPILARLVAVADAYSAMTSERPYRVALTSAEAQERIKREAGKQFDPDVVRAFLSLLGQASEAYVSGTDSDFAIEIGEMAAIKSEPSLALLR
ncbi:MAG: HD-GYP domain-containing protein [Gaiellaceae bacterium]